MSYFLQRIFLIFTVCSVYANMTTDRDNSVRPSFLSSSKYYS